MTAIGCSDQSKDDYSAAGRDMKSAAQETGKGISEDAEKAGQAIQDKTKDVGSAASKATDNAKAAIDNDKMSIAIKTAIGERKDIAARDLKVEVEGQKIMLFGSVADHPQMLAVEKIAKDVCGPQCVVDDHMTMK
jgi:osmotically-inducible protein OsmY